MVHEILVATEPDGRLKPGDPLPILYRIHKGDLNSIELVDSMPFPLPLNSLMIEDNVFYEDHIGVPLYWRQFVTTEHNYEDVSAFDSEYSVVNSEESTPEPDE